MATITPTTKIPAKGIHITTWVLQNGDVGLPSAEAPLADRSVHIYGTPGAGFNLAIEGSNDGGHYVTLTDPGGNSLSFNALSASLLKQILQNILYIRPNCTGGDGTTGITVVLLSRSTHI